MGVSDQLKEARKQAGMTQKDVEEATGIKVTTLSNWETGISSPDVEKIKILCNLYDVKPNEIFEWNEEQDELTEYLDELHKRPELKALFSITKKASKNDVEKAIKIIEMFNEERR